MSLNRPVLSTLALTMVAPFLLAPHYPSLDRVSFDYRGQGTFLDCQLVVVVPDGAGAAAIKALPESDATVALTLYDKTSGKLGHNAGVLDADGGISLRADPSTDAEAKLDVEVLAAEVFAAAGSHDVSLDPAETASTRSRSTRTRARRWRWCRSSARRR